MSSRLKQNQVLVGPFGEMPEMVPSKLRSMDELDKLNKYDVQSHIFQRETVLHMTRMFGIGKADALHEKMVQKLEEELTCLRIRLAELTRDETDQGIPGLKKQIMMAETLMHSWRVTGNADDLIPSLAQAISVLKTQLAQLSSEQEQAEEA